MPKQLCFSSKRSKIYRRFYNIFLKNRLKESIFAIFLRNFLKILKIFRRPGGSTSGPPYEADPLKSPPPLAKFFLQNENFSSVRWGGG